jgi:hypothetical protein
MNLLGFILVTVILVFIIHRSTQMDYVRSIGRSAQKRPPPKIDRHPTRGEKVEREAEKASPQKREVRMKIVVPKKIDKEERGQGRSNKELQKEKPDQYVSIARLIPKETYSYTYSPSTSVVPTGSISEPPSAGQSVAGDSTRRVPAQKAGSRQILQDVSTENERDRLTITFQTDSPIRTYNTFALDSPPRYVIDLYGYWATSGKLGPVKNTSLISGIRFGVHPDKMRVVIDLTEEGSDVSALSVHENEIIVLIKK